MGKLLIRADDLGYSEGANYGIEKSVRDGLIRSVGVMVNMPATLHGLNLLKNEKVCYGQHTNICVGRPITDPKLIPSITNEYGEFKSSKEYRAAKEDFVDLDEVILEIEAQYQRYKEIIGDEPHYFEGHAVSSMNFFKGLEIVAKRHNLKYLPFSLAADPILIGKTKTYISMQSMKPDYDPNKSMIEVVDHPHEDGCDIFICHPAYLDGFLIKTSSLLWPRPLEVDMLCDQKIKEYINRSGITLVTYDDL